MHKGVKTNFSSCWKQNTNILKNVEAHKRREAEKKKWDKNRKPKSTHAHNNQPTNGQQTTDRERKRGQFLTIRPCSCRRGSERERERERGSARARERERERERETERHTNRAA